MSEETATYKTDTLTSRKATEILEKFELIKKNISSLNLNVKLRIDIDDVEKPVLKFLSEKLNTTLFEPSAGINYWWVVYEEENFKLYMNGRRLKVITTIEEIEL